jgi:AraC-like DNA-binding protein
VKSIKGRPRDLAASVRQRLLNGAKERGEEFTFVLTRFALAVQPTGATRSTASSPYSRGRPGRRVRAPWGRTRSRVGDLADDLDVGLDSLEKRFRQAVGASPKQLATITRLRHAVESYRPGESLTRLSLDAGYFDQSHFIREFRAFTGTPPRRFFATNEHC